MFSNVSERLNQINDITRQLLSHISYEKKTLEDLITSPTESTKVVIDNSTTINKGLTTAISPEQDLDLLMSKRDGLIKELFEAFPPEQLSAEPELMQMMLSLDEKLVKNSQLYKELITKQIIKFKQREKVNKLYQKF